MARKTKEVYVWFKDTPDTKPWRVTVVVDGAWSEEEDGYDDSIFYYFEDEEEYQDALDNGTEEFMMEEL